MKTRSKNHAVKVTPEDRKAIGRWRGALTHEQAEAAAVAYAAIRAAHALFGPGQMIIKVLAASLPSRWVTNAVKAVAA